MQGEGGVTPSETLALLDAKLAEHGLATVGWSGGLDGAVRRFGVCRPGRRRITVSRHLAVVTAAELDEAAVRRGTV